MAFSSALLCKLRATPLVAVRDATRLLFSRYLLVTNTTVACGLAGAGDVITQHYEKLRHVRSSLSAVRTRNQCIQGLLFGPLYHIWYIYLDRALPGRTVRVVVTKLAADQLFMTPISIVLFFVSLAILERQKSHEMQHDIRHKGPPLLAVEWTFGPVTQLFNFFVLPTRFRVVYDSVVCLCFDVYYSYVKYRTEMKSGEVTPDTATAEHCD